MSLLILTIALAADPLPPWDFHSPDFDPDHPQITLEVREIGNAPLDFDANQEIEWSSARVSTAAVKTAKVTFQKVENPTRIGVLSAVSFQNDVELIASTIISDDVARRLVVTAQGGGRTNLVMGPKVTLFLGDRGVVSVGTDRAFNLAETFDEEPSEDAFEDNILFEGTQIAFQTNEDDPELVQFDLVEQEATDLKAVTPPRGLILPLERPTVTRVSFSVRERIANGRTLLIGARSKEDWRLYLLTPRLIRGS